MEPAMIVNQANVPAFLMKLWRIVEDTKCDNLICWSASGTTFYIRDQSRFAKELLPLYFKHNNMASFIRQLNMYGFRKVVNIEQGSLRAEKDEFEFQHMYFLKGHEYLLELIKRKITTGKNQPQQEEVKLEPQFLTKMLIDVKQLHGKQETLDVRLSGMKSENELLWREVANLRQQHKKQQQIVNKLIQFLLGLVHPKHSNSLGARRKMPLMLSDVSHSPAKSPRYSRSFSVGNNTDRSEVQQMSTGDIKNGGRESVVNLTSPAGPVIHDITDTFDAEAFLKGEAESIPTISMNSPEGDNDSLSNQVIPISSATTTLKGSSAIFESNDKQDEPVVQNIHNLNDIIKVMVDENGEESGEENGENNREATSLKSKMPDSTLQLSDILVPVADSDLNKSEFEEHLDTLQLELDSLKEFLSGNGCTIDPVSLLGLFSNEDSATTMDLNSSTTAGNSMNKGNGIVGTEVTQYQPMFLGIGDDASLFNTDAILPHSPDYLNGSIFDGVDSISDKRVSIPEEIDESHTKPNEGINSSPPVLMPSLSQHSDPDIEIAEIMEPTSMQKSN